MLPPFDLHAPTTLAEALALRQRWGDRAALYAGGSELLLAMKEGLGVFEHLIDVKAIAALHELRMGDDGHTLLIGAAVTHGALERSPLVAGRFPLLAETERQVANVRVRTVGTLGGNLCFAEPHSDPPTALLVLEATVALHGAARGQRLALAEFLTGSYETALGSDELLVRVEVPTPPTGSAGAYLKFGMHERPTVGVAVLLVPDARRVAVAAARVAVGCVGPVPARRPALEAALAGVPLAALAAGWAEAEGIAEGLDAVTDLHGSADYKRAMAGVFARRALALAARRSLGTAA